MARYAAIDIGSNSIRMEAAEVTPGQPTRILASDREVTRLGESVFREGTVSEEALRYTCEVLSRMAALYRKVGVVGVRAVATSAIRDTRNQKEFLARASQAAGVPIEIISGREEARLIHLGVESAWPQQGKRTLVIDIGGGSAEIIASDDGRLRESFSKPLGAVRLKELFLADDPPAARQLHLLHEYIQEKLESPVRHLGGTHWHRAVATSATAAAVAAAVDRSGNIDRRRVPTPRIRDLYAKLSERDLAGRRKVKGVGPRRAEIIVPGVAVLLGFLRSFHLAAVYYSRAGVRDGIIADLAARNVGAELSRLSRDQRNEVENMCRRYALPLDRVRKAAELSRLLFTSLQPLHELPPPVGKLIEAASCLLDTGHYVSGVGHHKHSYYLVSNSDMPGFTERERLFIAALCRYHRKSLPNPAHQAFQLLTPEERRTLLLAIPILRLADNLNRSHERRVAGIECRLRDGQVQLTVRSDGDIDLEQWGAARASEVFLEVYGRAVSIQKARD